MKTTIVSLLAGCAVLFTVGCATQKTVRQRGWIGGEYAEARSAHWLELPPAHGPIVHAFPDQVGTQQSSGILVSAVFTNTPVAAGGLQPGDLILRIDDRPVHTLREFRESIDACEPGAKPRFTVFREGKLEERAVVVGREQLERWHSFAIKLGLSGNLSLDLVPNPDFSMVVVGYRRYRDRLELHSPEETFARSVRVRDQEANQPANDSAEGWHTWLTIFNLKRFTRILSQEFVAEEVPGTPEAHAENGRSLSAGVPGLGGAD